MTTTSRIQRPNTLPTQKATKTPIQKANTSLIPLSALLLILLLILLFLGTCPVHAQVVKVYDTNVSSTDPVATYTSDDSHNYKVVFEKKPESPSTPSDPSTPSPSSSNFSVSATKVVQFTKGNLYWDGSAFKFETNQTDYPTSWNTSHIGHFFWTKTAAASYATSYQDGTCTTTDKLWCSENSPLTVDGVAGYYNLTKDEWSYLFSSRTNASSLYKECVTVTNNGKSYSNCLVIAPDNFTGTLQSSYTLDEINTLALICLPEAGSRYGDTNAQGKTIKSGFYYWTSTPGESYGDSSYYIIYNNGKIDVSTNLDRKYGLSIRLVKTVE